MAKDVSIENEIRQCEALRVALKEFGLEHAVRLMSVEERGYARRRFREALEVHVNIMKQGGHNGGTIADKPVGRDSGVAS